MGLTIGPRKIENNAYAKFLGINKVHYGQCGSGKWAKSETSLGS